MGMQLLYGSDGSNYGTIAKSGEMTEAQEKVLKDRYLGYDAVKNTDRYSSVYTEPAAFGYITTNLADELPMEMIVLFKKAKMSNYPTSYYAHFHLLDISEEKYGERFFELLHFSFIKDIELNDYRTRDINSFVQDGQNGWTTIRQNAVEEEKLLPVVAAVMAKADGREKVRLMLDEEGDRYNQRALEVIAAIYTYLPYNIRKKVSFLTFSNAESELEKSQNWAKLQLYTRDLLQRGEESVIDLADIRMQEIMQDIPENIARFAQMMVELEEAERKRWFEKFQSVFGLQDAAVIDHIFIYNHIGAWENGIISGMMDEMAEYAYTEMQKKKTSLPFQVFCRVLSKRFEEEQADNCYKEKLGDLLVAQDNIRFDQTLTAYIMLGEALDSLQFETATFLRWLQEKIIMPAEQKYKGKELSSYLKRHMDKMKSFPAPGEKFKAVLREMLQVLRQKRIDIKEELKEQMQAEKEDLAAFFKQKRMPAAKEAKQRYQQIKFKDNILYFEQQMGISWKNYLNCQSIDSDVMYKKVKVHIAMYKEYLSEEDYSVLVQCIEKNGKNIKNQIEKQKILLKRRRDLLLAYQRLPDWARSFQNFGISEPVYVLEFQECQYSMQKKDLEAVLDYLLMPDRWNAKEFQEIILLYPGILSDLIGIQAFQEEHFASLMPMVGAEEIRQVLRYYLNGDILLSKDAAEQSIEQLDAGQLADLLDEWTGDTILKYVLREKVEQDAANKKNKNILGRFLNH